jgi:hypothetical protein
MTLAAAARLSKPVVSDPVSTLAMRARANDSATIHRESGGRMTHKDSI